MIDVSSDVLNILLTGVGGQGIITLAKVIGRVSLNRGVNILMAETHGMSQRGGSVVVHVRLGNASYPLIPKGLADVILGLELIETFRVLDYASRDTIIIANEGVVRPALPNIKMPSRDMLIRYARDSGLNVVYLNARELAERAGDPITLNMVMLGALVASGVLPDELDINAFKNVIISLPMGDINLRAFEYGYDAFHRIVSGDIRSLQDALP